MRRFRRAVTGRALAGPVGVEAVQPVLHHRHPAAGEGAEAEARGLLRVTGAGDPDRQAQVGAAGDAAPLVPGRVDADVDTLAGEDVDRPLQAGQVEAGVVGPRVAGLDVEPPVRGPRRTGLRLGVV